jgi:hypothetical protein
MPGRVQLACPEKVGVPTRAGVPITLAPCRSWAFGCPRFASVLWTLTWALPKSGGSQQGVVLGSSPDFLYGKDRSVRIAGAGKFLRGPKP